MYGNDFTFNSIQSIDAIACKVLLPQCCTYRHMPIHIQQYAPFDLRDYESSQTTHACVEVFAPLSRVSFLQGEL